MPALDTKIEIDGADCLFEIKEVIPTAGTAKSRVGGASNAAGDEWNNDGSSKFEAYPVERVSFSMRGRTSTHHNVGDFLPALAHGPRTVDGSVTIRLKIGAKLLAGMMGSDKVGSTYPTYAFINLTGKGEGYHDKSLTKVTNLPKNLPVFAIKLTWMNASQSGGIPIVLYFQNVLLQEGGTGMDVNGAEIVSLSFVSTFVTGYYAKDGY